MSIRLDITVIILTLNEEIHIRRCIESVRALADRIVVVDSGSTDKTREIAAELGANVFENSFINYSNQFNWALDNTNIRTTWVMRLDADEYLISEYESEILKTIETASLETQGFTLRLRRIFMNRWLRKGGLYPIRLLRIWRFGAGRCEDRWMDEHVLVNGHVAPIDADFADHNLQSLTWWTDKHNRYANREAVDLLIIEFNLKNLESVRHMHDRGQAGMKRWIKEKIYSRLPDGNRAIAYFFYRYILRLGFTEGKEAAIFHFLQGFWYRYLVDAKIFEVKQHMRRNGVDVRTAILSVIGISI